MVKYKLQELPPLEGVGSKRVYPKIVSNGMMDTKTFVEKMCYHNHAISHSVVKAVLSDVADYLAEMLAEGYSVKLDDIGTFSLSLDFDDDKPKELTADDERMIHRRVRVKDVNYKAAPELKEQLSQTIEFERQNGGVKRLLTNKYTTDECLERTLAWIADNGFITLSDYAALNNCSRTKASLMLRQLSSGKDAPLDFKGKGSHKVWVKAEGAEVKELCE